MGHLRLGVLPKTRKWHQVIALIECGARAGQIANATIRAAERGLELAARDPGLAEATFLLTQIPLAARSNDFSGSLRRAGLDVSDGPSLMDIVGGLTDAVDSRLWEKGGRSDLGEMAQMAAAETIPSLVADRIGGLFETTAEDIQAAFAALATVRQFSILSRRFFSRLTHRYLNYFLSRELSNHIGESHRFTTLAQQCEFSDALELHCRQATVIIEDFSGEWFSKTKWERSGISRGDAGRFAYAAIKKITEELKQGISPHAE